jgi:hypothetical protein
MSDEATRIALLEFHDTERKLAKSFGRSRVLRHDNYDLGNQSRPLRCFLFFSMADTFTKPLIGELNKFLIGIIHADAWCQVAEKREKSIRLGLLWKFAEPQLELSVSRPYSIKNQLIFAAVHLLHQSKQLRDSNWKDDLPPNRHIKESTLQSLNANWNEFPNFLGALARLNDAGFRKRTFDIRHLIQHRFRTHFGFGITPYYERTKTSAGISYEMKLIPPLESKKVIPEMYDQHLIAVEVFESYWRLLLEMRSEWDTNYPTQSP